MSVANLMAPALMPRGPNAPVAAPPPLDNPAVPVLPRLSPDFEDGDGGAGDENGASRRVAERFELDLLGSVFERRYRKQRPDVKAMPWGTSALDPEQLLAARKAWTAAAFQRASHRDRLTEVWNLILGVVTGDPVEPGGCELSVAGPHGLAASSAESQNECMSWITAPLNCDSSKT